MPSNSIAEVGVMVHVLDGFERWDRPWDFDSATRKGSFACVTVVNARHPDIFEMPTNPFGRRRMPGFVLSDAPSMQMRLVCAYSNNGWSNGVPECNKTDPECRPGCWDWCDGLPTVKKKPHWCSFPPWRLKEAMEEQDQLYSFGHHERRYVNDQKFNEVCLERARQRKGRAGRKVWVLGGNLR